MRVCYLYIYTCNMYILYSSNVILNFRFANWTCSHINKGSTQWLDDFGLHQVLYTINTWYVDTLVSGLFIKCGVQVLHLCRIWKKEQHVITWEEKKKWIKNISIRTMIFYFYIFVRISMPCRILGKYVSTRPFTFQLKIF